MTKPLIKQSAHKRIPIKFADETKVHPALKQYFGHCLSKVTAKFRALMDEELSPLNLQAYHLGILKVLKQNGPTSQIQLGDELGIDKASMVKLIDHLEALKLVQRIADKIDRRIKRVDLTPAGAKQFDHCRDLKTKVEQKFFKKLSKKEQADLKRIIYKLLKMNS